MKVYSRPTYTATPAIIPLNIRMENPEVIMKEALEGDLYITPRADRNTWQKIVWKGHYYYYPLFAPQYIVYEPKEKF